MGKDNTLSAVISTSDSGVTYVYWLDEQNRKQGEQRSYKDGNLRTLTHYVDGLRHGEFKWWVDGYLFMYERYVHGIIDGVSCSYDEPGVLTRASTFTNGTRNGMFVEYTDGKMFSRGMIHNNKKSGIWIRRTPKEKQLVYSVANHTNKPVLHETLYYEDGKCEWRHYDHKKKIMKTVAEWNREDVAEVKQELFILALKYEIPPPITDFDIFNEKKEA